MKLFIRLRRWAASALALAAFASSLHAQTCAAPGQDGSPNPLSGTPNTYYPPAAGTFNAGSTAIALGASRGSATPIAPGDVVVVMQMQCATINTTNTSAYGAGGTTGRGYTDPAGSCLAGRYEMVRAGPGTTAASLSLAGSPLANTYVQDATTATNRRTFQVIRVPQYASATLGGIIQPPYWDGNTGGVVVLDVAGNLNWGGQTIDASSRGFRGAGAVQWGGGQDLNDPPDYVATIASDQHAIKGEGIGGTPRYVYNPATAARQDNGATWGGYANGDGGRGAPGNAGGGGNNRNGTRDNGGGGGGANGDIGGFGGYGWKSGGFGGTFTVADFDLRGIGGGAFAAPAPNRIVMGGGGGSGGNNNSGADPVASSGGAGGGIVIVRAGSFTGSGTINVNGAAGRSNALNDAGGGGGAGGSAVVYGVAAGVGALTINANGGAGGSSLIAGTPAHGGGGGGSAGVVLTSGAPTISALGGTPGQTNTGEAPVGGSTHGSTTGGTVVAGTPADPITSLTGPRCLPNLTVTKVTLTPTVTTASATSVSYTIVITNSGGEANGADIVDNTLPPGWTWSQTTGITFAPALSPTLRGGFVEGGTPGVPAVANAPGTAANLATNGAPATAPVWGNLTIPGITGGVPGRVTLSFVATVPTTAPVGCFHNPAGVKYLDPTRTNANPTREITPAVNNTANRAGAQVGGTVNTTYEGTGLTVPGSNYSGLTAGLAGEDVCLLGDLSITKTAPAAATAGQTITYTLAPRNNGRAIRDLTYAADQATPATNSDAASRVLANGVVRVVDTLPVGVTVTSALAPAGWACTVVGQTVTCDSSVPIPLAATTDLPAITGTVRITSAACSGPVVNTATIAGFQVPYSDTAPANNTATAATTLNCNANLSVVKTNNTGTVTAGGTTSYTVTYANAGPASADNATVRDVPGTGLSCTVASCAAAGGTPAASCPATPANLLGGSGVTLPSFPAGGTLTFTVNCDVTATGQ